MASNVPSDVQMLEGLGILRDTFKDRILSTSWTQFEAKTSSIFLEDPLESEVEVLIHSPFTDHHNAANKQLDQLMSWDVECARTKHQLDIALQKASTPGSSRILILSRLNSWSRLNITPAMFAAICLSDEIIAPFLKILTGFRQKWDSSDQDFMACYTDASTKNDHEPTAGGQKTKILGGCKCWRYSLCYNIRHFERHGQDSADPFSCRQSAIHHTYFLNSRRSSSVVIHPPITFRQALEGPQLARSSHPLSVHLTYLDAGLLNWREYLIYQAGKLRDLRMEVSISKPYGAFGIKLSSKQRINSLRESLYSAQAILLNTQNTIDSIRSHANKVAHVSHVAAAVQESFQNDLENLANEYDDITKSHEQELLHQNGLHLAQIAERDSQETKTMALLSDKTYRDSRTMRIATVVAMFYLPANLVISFFSSVLVWFENKRGEGGADSEGQALRVHSQTWLAVVISIALSALTVLASFWWDRRERRISVESC
ncbi:hypothetical protein F5Y10DRAFT_285562 [Nemania abortiva]|nr:hypothetical protein F5Y10DRAFT_285562 [Nemania abortiva]